MIDSRAKLTLSLFIVCVALTCPIAIRAFSTVLVLGMFALLPSFRPHSHGARIFFKRFIQYSLTVLVAVLSVNSILTREGDVFFSVGSLDFYVGGFWFGAGVASRLLLLSFGILLFFVSTPLREFAEFLRSTKMPPYVASITLLSLYFIEEIPERIAMIHAAQESRGAALRGSLFARARAFIAVLAPLIVSSLIESVQRGTTLELRGSLLEPPQRQGRIPQTVASRIVLWLFSISSLLLVLWKVFYGF